MTASPASASALTASARVATNDPSRYLLQLCKHFQGKVPVEFDRTHGTIAVGDGRCVLDADAGVLAISIVAPTGESVERLKLMVVKHLSKFDRHDRLTLEWM